MSTAPTEAAPAPIADAPPKAEPGRLAHWKLSLALVLGFLAVDHGTKFWAEAALRPSMRNPSPKIDIIPGLFDLVYAENTGAAFSFMTGKTGVLAVISVCATLGFSWFWYSLPAAERWGRAAVALILSGAIGNLVDRMFRGFVVDFFHAFWREYHYPIFNVADTCICVGAAILVWRGWKGKL